MRKIFQTSIAISLRRPKLVSLVPKIAFAFLAYPIMRQGIQNLNMTDHYDLTFKDDLHEGEMREFQVGPQKEDAVMVCKVKGKLYCVSNGCAHAGAPLSAGFLIGDKVKCPWHNAAFSVVTGANEEGPMLNGLQTFPVNIDEEGQVSVKIDKNLLNKKRMLNMVKKGNDPRHIVIVGGGVSGQSAAETLRQAGFEGQITIITSENYLPYDRTPMSKFLFQFSPQFLQVRNKDFYDTYGINLLTNTKVEQIDTNHQEVSFNGQKIKYDKLLLATGSSIRKPNIDGVNLKNVFTLRSIDDGQAIREQAKKVKNIVIVGASFIGMEMASSLKKELKDNVNITVVDVTSTPFERALGTQVGKALQDLHESNGINFELQAGVKRLHGEGNVNRVDLQNGKSLQADLVLLGTGVTPNNQLAKNVLKVSEVNGGVETDVFLKAAQNVYASGDIASYPYWVTGEHVRVEHQNEAIRQGYVAALNMLGRPVPLTDIPFFWTRMWDKTLSYSGVNYGYDEVIVDGSLKDLKFVAYYVKKGTIVASAAMNTPNAQMIISEAMRLNLLPSAEQMKQQKLTLDQIRQKVQERSSLCGCKRDNLCGQKL